MPRALTPTERRYLEGMASKLDTLYYYDKLKYTHFRECISLLGFDIKVHLQGAVTYHQIVPSKNNWVQEGKNGEKKRSKRCTTEKKRENNSDKNADFE